MTNIRWVRYLALPVVLFANVQPALAGLIEQLSKEGATRQIQFFEEIGQTFTAEDAAIASIGFSVQDVNSSIAPLDFDLTVFLYEGIGSSGPLIGVSTNDTLTDGFGGFLDFDFSTALLTVGTVYTALIDNDTSRWALHSNQHTFGNGTPKNAFDYVGGDIILNGTVSPFSDATFRVVPISEPGSVVLMFIGLGLLASRRGRPPTG